MTGLLRGARSARSALGSVSRFAGRVQERELDRDRIAGRACPVVDLEAVVTRGERVRADRLAVQGAAVRAGAELRPGPVVVPTLEIQVEVRRQGRCHATLHAGVVVDGVHVELEVLARPAWDALADARRLRDD